MKLYVLKEIAKRWQEYQYISQIRRVGNNEILIVFEKSHYYLIDLTKTASGVFVIEEQDIKESASFSAPFDKQLKACMQSADIKTVQSFEGDRIIKIMASKKNAYKIDEVCLQLEFTGRNTNAILLGEGDIIQEALRHIDKHSSYRQIQAGIHLQALKPHTIAENAVPIADIDEYLREAYQRQSLGKTQLLKTQILLRLDKQLEQSTLLLEALPNPSEVENEIALWQKRANLVLMHADAIDIYKQPVKIEDETFDCPSNLNNAYELGEYCFRKNKKQKAVLQNIHLQKENLEQKIAFLQRQIDNTQKETSIYTLEIMQPKRKASGQNKNGKISKKAFCYEITLDGFKVMIGRNTMENAKILQVSKKDDLWFHLQSIPSSHVVVVANKQKMSASLIEKVAKVCVDVSVDTVGKYIVDYTYRRNVKIKQEAQVNYVGQKSILVNKD